MVCVVVAGGSAPVCGDGSQVSAQVGELTGSVRTWPHETNRGVLLKRSELREEVQSNIYKN